MELDLLVGGDFNPIDNNYVFFSLYAAWVGTRADRPSACDVKTIQACLLRNTSNLRSSVASV